MEAEEWAAVPGYEGYYSASNCGRVRSETRRIPHPRVKSQRIEGKILAQKTTRSGHKVVGLSRDGVTGERAVHRLVLLAFVGEPPEGMICCHGDGDPANNTLANLRWDSPRENNLDTIKHGRNFERAKTHCPRGHELIGPNLVPANLRRGHRTCRSCHWAKQRIRSSGFGDVVALANRRYVQIRGAA